MNAILPAGPCGLAGVEINFPFCAKPILLKDVIDRFRGSGTAALASADREILVVAEPVPS